MILQDANVVLGVTGGIAAYKAVDFCSKLVQAGANVDVIMTEAATHFITPLPFQTITARPVSVDMFQLLRDTDMAHISLAQRASVIVIAPATANTIAKLAHGLADNLLTSTVLASNAPLIIAPAMDADMWANSVTQHNVDLLRERGVTFVGPGYGRLASGRMGAGRLVPTEEILAAVRKTLGSNGPLAGLHLAVTAGGRITPVDGLAIDLFYEHVELLRRESESEDAPQAAYRGSANVVGLSVSVTVPVKAKAKAETPSEPS